MIESVIYPYPDYWDLTTLGDIVARGGGGIQTGPFGSQLHASDYVSEGIPSVMPKNIGDNRIVRDGIAQITKKDAVRLSRYRLHSGDIVYSRRGNVERRALIRSDQDGWLCGTGCLRVRFGNGPVLPEYATYYLAHPHVRAYIVQHAIGATMPNLNTSILSLVPFLLPPKKEQFAISSLLGALDDKIELNRLTNETLEAMAQAIFKDWFVDFGPTRAKAKGHAPYLAPELWDLFPDTLDDEDKPVGWRVQGLGGHVSLTKGRSYKSAELRDSRVALVTLKSFERGGGYGSDGLKPYTGKYKPEQIVEPGELVIALTDVTQSADVIGKPAIVLEDDRYNTLVASLDVGIVRIRGSGIGPSFISQLLRTEQFQNHAYSHCTGTTVLHLSKDALPTFKACLPPAKLAAWFEDTVVSISACVAANGREKNTLAQIRDLLLPKLMSGEIRLREAEKTVEAVV